MMIIYLKSVFSKIILHLHHHGALSKSVKSANKRSGEYYPLIVVIIIAFSELIIIIIVIFIIEDLIPKSNHRQEMDFVQTVSGSFSHKKSRICFVPYSGKTGYNEICLTRNAEYFW